VFLHTRDYSLNLFFLEFGCAKVLIFALKTFFFLFRLAFFRKFPLLLLTELLLRIWLYLFLLHFHLRAYSQFLRLFFICVILFRLILELHSRIILNFILLFLAIIFLLFIFYIWIFWSFLSKSFLIDFTVFWQVRPLLWCVMFPFIQFSSNLNGLTFWSFYQRWLFPKAILVGLWHLIRFRVFILFNFFCLLIFIFYNRLTIKFNSLFSLFLFLQFL